MQSPEIRLGMMVISPIQPEQIERIRIWRNEQLDVLRQTHPISADEQIAYFDDVIWPDMNSTTPHQILVGIHLSGEFIGYGGLVHISWHEQRGEVSFLIRTDLMKDSGTVSQIFSDYLKLIKRLAFTDLGLRRLYTETFAHRTSIIQLLESNGFIREGRMREHVLVNSVPTDSIIHGCLAHDEK